MINEPPDGAAPDDSLNPIEALKKADAAFARANEEYGADLNKRAREVTEPYLERPATRIVDDARGLIAGIGEFAELRTQMYEWNARARLTALGLAALHTIEALQEATSFKDSLFALGSIDANDPDVLRQEVAGLLDSSDALRDEIAAAQIKAFVATFETAQAIDAAALLINAHRAELEVYVNGFTSVDLRTLAEAAAEFGRREGLMLVVEEIARQLAMVFPPASLLISASKYVLGFKAEVEARVTNYTPNEVDAMFNLSARVPVTNDAARQTVATLRGIAGLPLEP